MKLGHTIHALSAFPHDPLVTKALHLFKKRLEARTEITVQHGNLDDPDQSIPKTNLALIAGISGPELAAILKSAGMKPNKHPEGFTLLITKTTPAIRRLLPCAPNNIAVVAGGGPRGVLYGIGKLLRLTIFTKNSVLWTPVSLTETPATTERCTYLATHFNNWYERAPEKEIVEYVEELALWGFNAIGTWFDANWYSADFDQQPDSPGMNMVSRVSTINQTARAVGMAVHLVGIANEGFQHQPPKRLRADILGKRGGFYPYSQICPSQPGGLDMILRNRRRILKLLGPIDVYHHWPYDQGGCGCDQCSDTNHAWGKTFLKIGPDIARIVREVNPGAKFIISTWYMDKNELKMVYDLCKNGESWFDGVIMQTENAKSALIPHPYSKAVFPEISMFDCYFTAYGSNGANPAIRRFVQNAREIVALNYGAMLYSEGMYEDVNKATWATILWNPIRTAEDIADEYSGYYFGADLKKTGRKLLLALEETWGAVKLSKSLPETTEAIFSALDAMKHKIPRTQESRLRWKALWHRAKIDNLMKRVGSDRDTGIYRDAIFLFQSAREADGSLKLRQITRNLLHRLEKRNRGIQALFSAYTSHLKEFHLQRTTVLLFRPDNVLGSRDYTILQAGLKKALKARNNESLNNAVRDAFKRWIWLNQGVSSEFLFL